jgi:hypothetical protein
VLFRKREPVHRRLGRALMNAQAGGFLAEPPQLDGSPPMGEVGIHGVPRPRKWRAVATAGAPLLGGDSVHFTSLPDGSLVVDEEVADDALAPLADAIERSLDPPYRAEGVRKDGDLWTVAANPIDVVGVPEGVDGDEVSLTIHGDHRELTIDGLRTFGRLPSLERWAGERWESFSLTAERLDGDLWEVRGAPL